jgi:5-(carboxyamino)imidazole ribonucleotide synthase
VILPGATIGIVGGGQLGRMLAMEARRMGYRTLVLDPGESPPAAQVADEHLRAPLADLEAAGELARRSDVVTLEWENASVAVVRALSDMVPVRPGAHVLEIAQHRVVEKQAARRLGLDTADFRPVRSRAELHEAVRALGTPAILKTARGGYDGKGQVVISSLADADAAFEALAGPVPDLVLEERVAFTMEVSVICARSPRGEIATFPVSENMHSGGILDVTVAPARLTPELTRRAREIGETMIAGLDVAGVLAVELFVTADDRLLVNEIAPRPHNSGHYTWEGCSVSQFEQQLRAVCDLPLERPVLLRPSSMANLLGQHLPASGSPDLGSALSVPTAAVHLYGKARGRPGRKMGHITCLADSVDEAERRARLARDLLAGHTPRNSSGKQPV